MPANGYDVVVVGGGHNGLAAAGLLAKAGRRVVVLERRATVGGAAVTETPWGPDYKMSALSYVVSLLPAALVRELELERHGYRVFPQGPYFAPLPGGRHLQLPDDPIPRHKEISKLSPRDADAMEVWDAWLTKLAGVLGPLLLRVPPKLGSKRPADLLDQSRLAWQLRQLDTATAGEVTRLFTSSIADLLDDQFESPELKGVLSVSGVIGTWAGPRSPGTGYVMVHHKIGDIGEGAPLGAWGFPEGGMGAVSGALRDAAARFGAEIRVGALVARILVRGGRASGVVLESGEELLAPIVVATTHPKITFLRQLDREDLPEDFVTAIERWKTRSGTVKVNVALDRLPRFTSHPEPSPDVYGGTIVLAPSLDHVERAFQQAVGGVAAERPFADICIPSVFDRTLAPEGHHVMSMFTQWVPCEWSSEPHQAELEAYADRVVAEVEQAAPGFTASILHRQVIGPYEMEHTYGLIGGNIFHGELSAGQLFHMRPVPGFADHRTPIAGLYMAGSATHGGGGVTGIPALNVVRAITHDQRIARLRHPRRARPRHEQGDRATS
jgi:phytoene dehydrogenase-like protein